MESESVDLKLQAERSAETSKVRKIFQLKLSNAFFFEASCLGRAKK